MRRAYLLRHRERGVRGGVREREKARRRVTALGQCAKRSEALSERLSVLLRGPMLMKPPGGFRAHASVQTMSTAMISTNRGYTAPLVNMEDNESQ